MVLITKPKIEANRRKFQFMILGKSLRLKYGHSIGPINVKEADYIELVGISADKHLGFKK